MLSAARLDQRLKLQQRATPAVKNDRGEDVSPWEDVVTDTPDHCVWGSADPKRGAEFMAAQQLQAEGPVVFRIRWRDGVHTRMRVLWHDVPYAIVSPPVDVAGQRESLDLYCATGLRDGD
jgi:SPP1 family predicted phage head-tail adaptor